VAKVHVGSCESRHRLIRWLVTT